MQHSAVTFIKLLTEFQGIVLYSYTFFNPPGFFYFTEKSASTVNVRLSHMT